MHELIQATFWFVAVPSFILGVVWGVLLTYLFFYRKWKKQFSDEYIAIRKSTLRERDNSKNN